MLRVAFFFVAAISACAVVSAAADSTWQAGVARVKITPRQSMWLSGYASRDKPARGTLHELWAKALVLKDGKGRSALLITADLVGIDRGLSRKVCQRIEQRLQIPRSAIALTVSHTHTGPVVGTNLATMYDLDQEQTNRVAAYAVELADHLVQVATAAHQNLQPAQLSWGIGTATFAVNRRNNPETEVPRLRADRKLAGPVDHDVPVLSIRDAAGELRAIVCGYACHATVLNDYFWSGDWPGFAQIELEKRHPGATVLFWAGCGADQNPLPRRSVELAQRYGVQLADAVDKRLEHSLQPIQGPLQTAYREIDLPFGRLPARNELEGAAGGMGANARWAKFLLSTWDRERGLQSTYPYPVQMWRLGSNVNWVFLGGEVVVDYSFRLKGELGNKNTWITSYANDVMGYIPSRRVLMEGGYEGRNSMYGYGLPAPWNEQVEELIVEQVRDCFDEEPRREQSRNEAD